MRIYEIPGTPIAWRRAGRKGSRYYDAQAKQKETVQKVVRVALSGLFPHKEPIKVDMHFGMPIPKSWSTKKRIAAIGKPHSSRPDVDNLIKFVSDALNEILWDDDAIIYQVRGTKTYTTNPKTLIFVMKCDDEDELVPLSANYE